MRDTFTKSKSLFLSPITYLILSYHFLYHSAERTRAYGQHAGPNRDRSDCDGIDLYKNTDKSHRNTFLLLKKASSNFRSQKINFPFQFQDISNCRFHKIVIVSLSFFSKYNSTKKTQVVLLIAVLVLVGFTLRRRALEHHKPPSPGLVHILQVKVRPLWKIEDVCHFFGGPQASKEKVKVAHSQSEGGLLLKLIQAYLPKSWIHIMMVML